MMMIDMEEDIWEEMRRKGRGWDERNRVYDDGDGVKSQNQAAKRGQSSQDQRSNAQIQNRQRY